MRLIVDDLDAAQTLYVIDVAGRWPKGVSCYALRLTDCCDVWQQPAEGLLVSNPYSAVVSLGRTKTVFVNAQGIKTTENSECLHSGCSMAEGGERPASSGLVKYMSGEVLEGGGASSGKLPATQTGFAMARPMPHGWQMAAWRRRERERITAENEREMAMRLACAHIYIRALRRVAAAGLDVRTVTLTVVIAELETVEEEHELQALRPLYGAALVRLAGHGLHHVTPTAGVRATSTKWDLEALWAWEDRHQGPQLVSVVEPNAQALANGMLREELGDGNTSRWATPYDCLVQRLSGSWAPLPPPPPLPYNSEAVLVNGPSRPSPATRKLIQQWWTKYRQGRGRKRGSAMASDSAAALVLPSAARRARQTRRRLIDDD